MIDLYDVIDLIIDMKPDGAQQRILKTLHGEFVRLTTIERKARRLAMAVLAIRLGASLGLLAADAGRDHCASGSPTRQGEAAAASDRGACATWRSLFRRCAAAGASCACLVTVPLPLASSAECMATTPALAQLCHT